MPVFHARATECVHGGGSCSRLRLSLQADARCFLQMFGLVQHFTELTTGKHEWTEVGNKSVSSRTEAVALPLPARGTGKDRARCLPPGRAG